jgi:hypothetical protein
MKPILFNISDSNVFSRTLRMNPKDYDCFVNAMEILGFYHSVHAAAYRNSCSTPFITSDLIEQEMMSVINKRYGMNISCKFNLYLDLLEIEYKLKHVHTRTCVLIGFTWMDGSRHVVVAGRDLAGNVVCVDPQHTRADTCVYRVEEYLNMAIEFFILEY